MLCKMLQQTTFLKYISYFLQKIGFDILCELSICMKYQSLFSRENKKNIVNLSYTEFAHRVVKVYVNMRKLYLIVTKR